jgi:hypothetical protein
MATDVAVQDTIVANVCPVIAHVFPWDEPGPAKSFRQSLSILRRAYKRQECFACEKVESVANTTAFVSPAALDLEGKD